MYTSTLKPGLLVALSTSCRGNVQYRREDIKHAPDGSMEMWETTKTVADPEEQERATKAQSKARSIVVSVCVKSAFGYLCPERDADVLDAAVANAQRVIDTFNSTARLTRLRLNVMTGKIASDDVEAAKKISREIRDLMDDMTAGIQRMDVGMIREAAAQAKEVSQMLTAASQANVQIAVDAARKTANEMAKLVRAGEAAAIEIDTLTIRKITEQRTAFLDMSDEVAISAPAATARAIDLTPSNGE